MNQQLKLNHASISIQASSGHYCLPREDKADWTHKEIALFSPTGDWLDTSSPKLADFPKLTELVEVYKQGSGSNVGAYVPIELINDLIHYLSRPV